MPRQDKVRLNVTLLYNWLYSDSRPVREYFTHVGTSSLLVKGYKAFDLGGIFIMLVRKTVPLNEEDNRANRRLTSFFNKPGVLCTYSNMDPQGSSECYII